MGDLEADSDIDSDEKSGEYNSHDKKKESRPALSTSTAACEKDCTFEGQSASCGDRMKFSLGQGGPTQHACENSWGLVRSQCKVCGKCQLSECPDLVPDPDHEPSDAVKADDEQDEDTADDKTEVVKPSCDTDCVWDGISATCAERISYSAQQEGGSCRKAEKLVFGQCSECVGCTAEAA